MNNILKRVYFLVICFILSFLYVVPVQAAEEGKTILKVAYCPLDGFFEYDSQGNEIGYGVDILDKISQYTGIKFKYVKIDSWEETKQMLIDGKADIRMPGTMPSKPSTVLGYSNTSILDTYEAMLTLKSREDLYYQDYDTIHTLKIAIVDSFYTSEGVQEYLTDIGVSKEQLEFCSEYNECYQKLKDDKVDALITNIMDMTDDMKMLVRFNSVSNFITTLIDSPYLNMINDAVTDIKIDEPMFLSNLYEKWFPQQVTVPLTLEENGYLASIDSLTFAFRTDEGYLSHYRDGQFYGIYVDQAKLICEKLGKRFKAVSLEDCLEGNAKADVYAGFFYDQNYANEWNYSISAPIRDINYYMVQKKEENNNPYNCKIAAIEKFKYTSDYLQKQYVNADFQYYETYEDCLKAVESGKADMTIINNYIAEYYLGMYQYSDLSVRLSNDYSHMFCFATDEDNKQLASILTKGLSMLTDKEIAETYITGQQDKAQTKFWEGVLYKYPITIICTAVLIAGIIVLFIMLLVISRRQKIHNVELEQALSAKSIFLARMSHDMRTPLNVIIGMNKIARENANPEDTDNCLGKIDIASEFLLGLINDILDVEQVNSGKMKFHMTPYSMNEFSQYIDAVILPLCIEKNIKFEYSCNAMDNIVVMQDKLRINQIYFNLLSNAVKFTHEGGRVSFYTDVTKKDNDIAEITATISDTGIGMDEKFQKHVFESFSQEEQVLMPTGMGAGLGLSIVKRICDEMNIDISFKSEVGKGTTFILKGEFEICQDVIRKQDGQRITEDNIDDILLNRTILVCEDHPLNQEIIRRILEKKGMIVEVADDGKIGLDYFAKSAPRTYDAVLMDIRMPVMDGIEATKEIRKLYRDDAKKVPIIALTANAYEADVKKCLDAGMNEHLAKPIQPELIYKALAKYISKNYPLS